ncbi:ATP-binding protein [Pollutibacter soli]|uniref:ATP-binding protein n=1 Tax=Pollutibacter soli TaxID=3034157 RepID=UPI003013DD42
MLPFFLQSQEIIILDDPGKSFILLNNGWRYSMTDQPEAVMPGFDDSRWKPIRPAADIHDSIPEDAKKGVGWMRLRIRLPEEAGRRKMSMLVKQSVASEIYLNGILIATYGTINSKNGLIKAEDPHWAPVYLPLSNDSVQTFSVRFAAQPGIKYITFYGTTNPFLNMMIMRESDAIGKYRGIFTRPWLDMFMQGIMFMAFILHMAFYIMYPARKANLYFSLALLFTVTGGIVHNYYYYGADQDKKFQFGMLASSIHFVGQILMLASIQNYLNVQKKLLLWLTGVFCIASLITASLWYKKGFEITLSNVPFFIYIMIIIISIIAWRRNMKEARILTIGFVIALICFFLFLTNAIGSVTDHLLNPPLNIFSFFFLGYIVAPPAAVSIFLANDFARTSKRLQQKLNEVATLSEKNLAVEKEKQEILASQNLKLETLVTERTSELHRSLTELKTTQAQLIQAEKMASLGELTAGIAHEIQNPLNFINNFSDVNAELIVELQEELNKGKISEASLIANSLKENEVKINNHGKRADGIVKSMLQHTGSTSGHKEMTDVNKLVEEYARLAYHGYRAKQKDFQATMEFNFDKEDSTASIVSQDIGRVVVNILNNAFYAVSERSKKENGLYSPTVKISTRAENGKTLIEVEDNADGVPERIREKIFQPFFTTKPTGQATGLGLSLSYDIVKAHGGEIRVSSMEGKGSKFVVVI